MSVVPSAAPLSRAMVLAAGLGSRLRPLTDSVPKPLVRVQGKPLIDWALDRLHEAGVEDVVVNLHHLPDLLRCHLSRRQSPRIVFSDETDQRLETGGGVRRALPLLGDQPFFVVNSDVIWLNGAQPTLRLLAEAWNPETMDALLLLHPQASAHGYEGQGDFTMDPVGRLERRQPGLLAPFIFAGVQILHPRLFENAPEGAFSLNVLYDRALSEGRLGAIAHDGKWFHVGTPQALKDTDQMLAACAAALTPH
ncbi:nucleotidyltransferase family protein [Pararhodospirillum photometricum]|nr:nucleotidyltransferase family protein [Pararhodospirillum photometricum]